MIHFELTVRRLDENPKYAEWVEEQRVHRWNEPGGEPPRFLELHTMRVAITEAQFEAIRKAVLEVF